MLAVNSCMHPVCSKPSNLRGWLHCICCTFQFNNLKDKSLQVVADNKFLMRTEYYSMLRRTVFKGMGRNELPVHEQSVKSPISQLSCHLAYLYSFLMHIRITYSTCIFAYNTYKYLHTVFFSAILPLPLLLLKIWIPSSCFCWRLEPRNPENFDFFFSLWKHTYVVQSLWARFPAKGKIKLSSVSVILA